MKDYYVDESSSLETGESTQVKNTKAISVGRQLDSIACIIISHSSFIVVCGLSQLL